MAHILQAKGLSTLKSKLTGNDGDLSIADNIVIDADNIIESRRGFNDYGTALTASDDRVNQLMVYKDRIFRHFDSTLQFDSNGTGTFSSFNGTYSELVDGLRLKYQEAKRNLYFTSLEGVKKISANSASDFTTTSGFITNAGGVKAIDLSAILSMSTGGFLPAQSKVAYRLVWGINDLNDNLVRGTPSSRIVIQNNTSDVNTAEYFTVAFSTASETNVAGKVICFSSNTVDYAVYFSNTGNPNAPQTADTLGRTLLECDVQGFGATTASIINAFANVVSTLTSEFSVEISGTNVVVTSTQAGNNLVDAFEDSSGITNVTVTVTEQGSVTTGLAANVTLTCSVPSDVTSTDYFYQLYRTPIITTSTGLTLDDIDPGDECQLVFEQAVTAAEISAGTITIADSAPETFRALGEFLYTNENTGEGILQSNERPPIAHDLALFANSMFYANTKTVHRKQISLLSVTGFVSGTSTVIIGNSTIARTYTARGVAEISTITCDTYANTTADSYIEINSARDERKYYIWFDKGSGTDPAVSGRIKIRVDISGATSAADISALLASALDALDDFSATDGSGSVTVTNHKNGNTTNIALGATSPGGSWAVAVSTAGDGEDTSSRDFLLSSLASPAQAIEETALSLVKVINSDASSPVNAFYLSGPDDLPGIIMLENKSLSDVNFYVGTSDSNITEKFNPELPSTGTITNISVASSTQITDGSHGLSTGNEIYIFNTDSTPAILGKYTVTVVDANNFTIPFTVTSSGSSGSWFLADVASSNDVAPNRVYYSKIGQPEAVPILNFLDIGRKDKAIQRILALRDNLIVLKEDGIHLISGTSAATGFISREIESTSRIVAPDTAVVLQNSIFVLSTQGVIQVTGSGAEVVSRPIEDKILGVTTSAFNYTYTSFGVSYESDRAYLLWVPSATTDTVATQCYRFNTFTRAWTRWSIGATAGVVNDANDVLYVGASTREYVYQERKNKNRTDYSDRDFALSLGTSAVSTTTITLSSNTNVEVGDALVQTQFVSIARINRLLRQLDADTGLDDNDYYSTLSPSAGDNLQTVLDAINTKLVADDSSGTISAVSFSSDFDTIKTEFNAMIAELNDSACDTVFTNYDTVITSVQYEVLVTEVLANNKVVVNLAYPFLEGPIQCYKHINVKVDWYPQHFGDPQLTKQVHEAKIIVDQNNFYTAKLSFNTDISQNFESSLYYGKGTGLWGGDNWGESIWGGSGNEAPLRRYVPINKQRCRYLRVRYEHYNAREQVRVLGIALEPRAVSIRGWR